MVTETGDVLVETIIQVFDHDNILDFGFDRGRKLTRLVINSQTLRSSLEHFDIIGLETNITMNPHEPKFLIKSEGVVGHVQIEYNEELVNKEAPFRCVQPVSHNYQTAFLKK